MNQNHEMLVDYLDGQLNPEVSAEVKNRVKQDKDFAVELAQARQRERTYRSTLIGPHRDWNISGSP